MLAVSEDVSLDKAGIKASAPLKGFANKQSITVAGKRYTSGALRFDGFVGESNGCGMWVGRYLFAEVDPSEYERASFAKLFPKESEVTDVV